MSDAIHEGGCLCGSVRYRTTGAPNDTNICYCTQCQKQTGAPLPAFASFPLTQFELISGELGGYRASDFATREFCPKCGSALFWRRDGADYVSICLGGFDDPSDFPTPKYEIWTDHRIKWLTNIPGVDSYPGDN
ncbi:aldehyde-activating protein [Skermanella stibiiresistens SB22]|uniref:Aldehyde-activating protein n=1 Tax=Skermanella stibiiresistens SB22 TaxID=1385369 RepID=W9HCF6_9PROT|nr:GFA family protein [Skermanella stibiiresistens]EWY42416.1 aldehyde-activating protein [Skermanella stibiiresistens SB22]